MEWKRFERPRQYRSRSDPFVSISKDRKSIFLSAACVRAHPVEGRLFLLWDEENKAVAFKPAADGDHCFSGQKTSSTRQIRARTFIRAAEIPAGRYDPETFVVDGSELLGFSWAKKRS